MIDIGLKSDCKMHTIVLQSMEGMYNRGLEHDCNGLYLIVTDCSTIGVKTIGSQSVSIVSIVPQSKIGYNSKRTRLEHDCLIVRIQKLPYIPYRMSFNQDPIITQSQILYNQRLIKADWYLIVTSFTIIIQSTSISSN